MKNIIKAGTTTSRSLNHFLGDKTGRTVTKTLMDGASNLTNGKLKLSGGEAHFLLATSTGLLCSKNPKLKLAGGVVGGLLLLSYLAGRE